MTAPVRLQRRRVKGFDLQALSRSVNGLPAVDVTRAGKWGNPFDFRKSECCWLALAYGCRGDRLGRQEASVRAFREWIDPGQGRRTVSMERGVSFGNERESVAIGPRVTAGMAPSLDEVRAELAGKNLACWCRPGEPCHADVLLELANAAETEERT